MSPIDWWRPAIINTTTGTLARWHHRVRVTLPDRTTGANKLDEIVFEFAPYRTQLEKFGPTRNVGYEAEFNLGVGVLNRDAPLTASGTRASEDRTELQSVRINIVSSFGSAEQREVAAGGAGSAPGWPFH